MYIRQGCVFSFEDAIKMQTKSRLEIILDTLNFEPIISKSISHHVNCRRGPNGYSVETKLNALIAMRVYNMDSFKLSA